MGRPDADIRQLTAALEIAAVGTAEAALVKDGTCVPPTVHLISEQIDSPYVGYVMTRPFTRGPDASAAIATMGALPAAMRARELVVTWGGAASRLRPWHGM